MVCYYTYFIWNFIYVNIFYTHFCQWKATLGQILFFVRKELLEYLIVVEKREVLIVHLCLK